MFIRSLYHCIFHAYYFIFTVSFLYKLTVIIMYSLFIFFNSDFMGSDDAFGFGICVACGFSTWPDSDESLDSG